MKRTNKKFLVVILSLLLTLTVLIAMPVTSMASGSDGDELPVSEGDGSTASTGGAIATPSFQSGEIYVNAYTEVIDEDDRDLGYTRIYEMTFSAGNSAFSAYEISFYMPYFVDVQSVSASNETSISNNAIFTYYIADDGLVNVSYSNADNLLNVDLFTVFFTVNNYTPNYANVQYIKSEFVDVDLNDLSVNIGSSSVEISRKIIMGDVNDNGYVDINDIEIIQNSIVNPNAPLTAEQFEVADINRDGIVSIRDCQYIQNYLVGRIGSLDDIKDYVPVVYTLDVRFRDETGKVVFTYVCEGVEGNTYDVVLAPAVNEFAQDYNAYTLVRVRSNVYGTIPVTSLLSEYVLIGNDVVNLYYQFEPDCEHRDRNDNLLCDKCGEAFDDGKDLEPESPVLVDFEGAYEEEVVYWNCTHPDHTGDPAQTVTNLNFGGYLKVTHPGGPANPVYANSHNAYAAVVEEEGNKFVKVVSPARISSRDRQHSFTAVTSYISDDANAYIFEADMRLHTTLPDGSACGTNMSYVIYNTEGDSYIQMTMSTAADGLLSLGGCPLAYVDQWFTLRMEFNAEDCSIKFYVKNGDVWEYRGFYEAQPGDHATENPFYDIGASIRDIQMFIAGKAQFDVDNVTFHGGYIEFIEDEEIIAPVAPTCEHSDIDDNGECDECGEAFEDGAEPEEGPVLVDFEGEYQEIVKNWNCTHPSHTGAPEQTVTDLNFGGYIKVEHPGGPTGAGPNYTNSHNAYAAVVEEDGNKFVKVVSPARISPRDRQHSFRAITSYVSDDANAYIFEADYRIHNTLPDGGACGTNMSFIIYNTEGNQYIQITMSTGADGLLSLGGNPIAYVNEWFTLRMEFFAEDGSIKFYVKNGDVWEFRGFYEMQSGDHASEGVFEDIGATIRDIQMSIAGMSQFDVDDVALYGDYREFIYDEPVIPPTMPTCAHRDVNDDLLCDMCGEWFDDGVEPEPGENPSVEDFEGEYDSNDKELFYDDAGNVITGTATEIAIGNVSVAYGGATNQAGSNAAIVEDGGNRYLKITSPKRTYIRDRSYLITITPEEFVPTDKANCYVLNFDVKAVSGRTLEMIWRNTEGQYVQINANLGTDGYYSFKDTKIVKAGEWCNVRMELSLSELAIMVYVDGTYTGAITEMTGGVAYDEFCGSAIASFGIGSNNSGANVDIGFDNMAFYYSDKEYVGPEIPVEPECEHRDVNDDLQCDKCGEYFDNGANEPEIPVEPAPEINYTVYDFNDLTPFINEIDPNGNGVATINPELYGDMFKMVRSLCGSQTLKDRTWGIVELEEGSGENALWISGIQGGSNNGGNRHAHFDLAYETIAHAPDRWVWGANLYFETFTSAVDTFEILFNLTGGGWLATPDSMYGLMAFALSEDPDSGEPIVWLDGASDEAIARIGEYFHIAIEYIPETGVINTYVNGALLDTEKTTADVTINNIRLEVPSGGRVSLLLDNMFFVYADDSFVVPGGNGGSIEPPVEEPADPALPGGVAVEDFEGAYEEILVEWECTHAEILNSGFDPYQSATNLIFGENLSATYSSGAPYSNVHGSSATVEDEEGNKFLRLNTPLRACIRDRAHTLTVKPVIGEGEVESYVFQTALRVSGGTSALIVYNEAQQYMQLSVNVRSGELYVEEAKIGSANEWINLRLEFVKATATLDIYANGDLVASLAASSYAAGSDVATLLSAPIRDIIAGPGQNTTLDFDNVAFYGVVAE